MPLMSANLVMSRTENLNVSLTAQENLDLTLISEAQVLVDINFSIPDLFSNRIFTCQELTKNFYVA